MNSNQGISGSLEVVLGGRELHMLGFCASFASSMRLFLVASVVKDD